jgi:DNA-binding response OmpR family regulator
MELKNRIVLLVDDDEAVRKLVQAYLESFGAYVLVAESAAAATRLMASSPLHVDLLLTDVLLPYVNGRDLANRICMQRPDIKVLFISGYPIEVLESHGLCPSRAELLPKPFGKKELAAKVRMVLEDGVPWRRLSTASGGRTLAGPAAPGL